MEFQINTTITANNLHQIKDILKLAKGIGAAAHHIFLLVPTGRGKDLAAQAITAADYEETLMWFYRESMTCGIQLKATCAPHYFRIMHQKRPKGEKPVKKPGGHFMNRPEGVWAESRLLYFAHRPGATLRLSGTGLRKREEKKLCEHMGKFGNIPQPAGLQ